MTQLDRRVQRTRELLQHALIGLVRERAYDAITIQDIVDRANVGRTTFYLHYSDKDALFMSCHETIINGFHFGPQHLHTREALLSFEVSRETIAAYQHLQEARAVMQHLFHARDGVLMLQRIRDGLARDIEASLRAAFVEADSLIPIDMLARYIAGAQVALIHWWLEKPQPHTPEKLAQTLHRLQRAAICDAFGLYDGGHIT